MAGLDICVRFLLVSLTVAASGQAFLTIKDVNGDISDVSLPAYPGKMTSSMTKRMPNFSINQDLKTLADLVLSREYARQAENRRNRELLQQIGKRSADFSSQSERSHGVTDSAEGSFGLVPAESNENWSRTGKEAAEEGKYGMDSARTPTLTLWRVLTSN